MDDFHIIEIEGNKILWRYRGQDGTTNILDGRCVSPGLCEADFLLSQSASMKVLAECQQWLDDKPNRDRANRVRQEQYEYYSTIWESWLDRNTMEYAYPSIPRRPDEVIAEGRLRFAHYANGESDPYFSRTYTNPTWADAMREFDQAIMHTGDYHHCFLEGVSVGESFANEIEFISGS